MAVLAGEQSDLRHRTRNTHDREHSETSAAAALLLTNGAHGDGTQRRMTNTTDEKLASLLI